MAATAYYFALFALLLVVVTVAEYSLGVWVCWFRSFFERDVKRNAEPDPLD